MSERIILTGVAWADIALCWIWRVASAGLVIAGLAGLGIIIWGITRKD